MGSPNPVSSGSTTDCVRSCNNRAGCVIGVYKRATGECYLKAPYPAKAANVVSGYIETTSSSSPPPQENGNSSPAQANVPNQPKQENGKSVPAMDNIASTSSFSTSDNKASNGAVIGGGVGGSLVLLILAVGGFLCFKRNKKPGNNNNKKDQTKISGVASDTERDGLAQSQPEFLTSNSVPEYCVVNSVPGYYCAIQDHTAENEEQLTIVEGQRLYVTSTPNKDGWCTVWDGREGLVPVSKLGVVG
ncbi:hypothetical protein BDR26DRAFT_866394 [Obelidium mucronatum]|nr:hypothetical protein BDR26DRAFT_866394 [Obelidium mucronatum]